MARQRFNATVQEQRERQRHGRSRDEDLSLHSGISLTSEVTVFTSVPDSPGSGLAPEFKFSATTTTAEFCDVTVHAYRDSMTGRRACEPSITWTTVQPPPRS